MTALDVRKILLVHEAGAFRSHLADSLRSLPGECHCAASAAEAAAMLASESYDLVISAWKPQGKDGVQFWREARAAHPCPDVLVIAEPDDSDCYTEMIEAGAADFITRPFTIAELHARIARIATAQRTLSDRQQAHDSLLREARLNDFFTELLKSLAAPLAFETISQLVLDCAMLLTSSQSGLVGYVDATTGRFVVTGLVESAQGESGMEYNGTGLGGYSGLWERLVGHDGPILANDCFEEPGAWPATKGPPGFRRLLASPARIKDQVAGLIAVANADGDYTDNDLSISQGMADIYALAIQRKWGEAALAREQDELRANRDQLAKLAEERSTKLTAAGQLLKRSIEAMRGITETECGRTN